MTTANFQPSATSRIGSIAPGQDPIIGGLANVPRLKTYNEQPVSVILDDSGSMSGAKAVEATKSCMALLSELSAAVNRDGFRVSVIKFGSSSTLLAKAEPPENIKIVLSGSSGGTNASPAMQMALNCEQNFTPRAERRRVGGITVFMSDGHLADTDKTIRIADELKKQGVTIICIGFGDADAASMQRIATSPQHYAYASVGGLQSVFASVGKTISQSLTKAP